jgi:hypothetical protein
MVMKIWFCAVTLFVWVAGASASVVYTAPSASAERLYPAPRLTVLPAQGRVPQQDYTALLITHGEGIITGGPLSYGPALSGIMDFSGPDQEQIMAFLESSDYLERSMTMVARFTNAARPNLPRGVQFKRANMVDLWPQQVWVIQTQWMQSADFPTLQRAAVPEPCTALLFMAGGIVVLCRRHRRA